MLFYLMRHGPAAAPGEAPYTSDAERPLTERGMEKTQAAARGMQRLGMSIDWILSSPLMRAQQTAAIVQRELGLAATRLRLTDHLQPGGSAAALLLEIGALEPCTAALVVGHEPDLSALAAQLLAPEARLRIEFKKATLCVIELLAMPPHEPGMLVALLQPKHLRAIGGT